MMVCHVTEEEYKIMLKQIKNGGLNERLPRIARDELGYNKFFHKYSKMSREQGNRLLQEKQKFRINFKTKKTKT